MTHGGQLVLKTATVELDASYSAHHFGIEPGPYVMLAVSDTGIGMDRATQTRIFEPFFTTKEAGRGTGLGLSIVAGIIKQAGGDMSVQSTPGSGTTFNIYLPVAVSTGSPRADDAPGPARGGATVLVVDDEPGVRRFVAHTLREGGYSVAEASNAEEAMERARESVPDLVLTDVELGQTTAAAVVESLRSIRPNLKVIYMSGYDTHAVKGKAGPGPTPEFLQKPFSPMTLLRHVDAAFGAVRNPKPARD
jgi:CheY-like chemotaxis protein